MATINIYRRVPLEQARVWVDDFRPRLAQWFADNPQRKICKVEWFDGRSIDLHRSNFETKLAAELERYPK